jgi:HSP20 family protein
MTNLIRFTPASDLARMQREIDQLFSSFFPTRSDNGADMENAVWSPRVDLSETEDAYLLWLDLPGVSKEDVEINYQEGTLTVSGERSSHKRDEKQNFVRVERSYGRFFRSFNLPKVDADRIEAGYQDGVLSIRVPKAEETKPRRITIS